MSNNSSNNVTYSGPFIGYKRPDTTPPNDESGSAFRIGDGVYITAAHVAMEFNQETDILLRNIFESSNILLKYYGYRSLYPSHAMQYNVNLTYTDTSGNTKQATNIIIESGVGGSLSGRALSGLDSLLVSGSGNVDKDDAGIVTLPASWQNTSRPTR